MLIVGALALVMMAGLEWWRTRDVLSPTVLYCGVWGLTLCLLALFGRWYYPVSPAAVAVYVLGGFAFGVGGWLAVSLKTAMSEHSSRSSRRSMPDRRIMIRVAVLVALELVLLVPYVQGQLRIAGSVSWTMVLKVIRIQSLLSRAEEGSASTLSLVANAPIVALAAAVAAWYVRGTKPAGAVLAALAVGGAFVIEILTGAKMGIVSLLVSLAALSALQSPRGSGKKLLVGISIALVVFAIGVLAINFAYVVPGMGTVDRLRLAGQTTLGYWLGGAVAFSNVVENPQALESTQPLMAFFLNTAHSLGLRSSSAQLHAAYTAIGPGSETNVYTIFFTYFKDHGWLGMMGLSSLLGALLSLLHRVARRGEPLATVFYALFVPGLLLSIHAEHFWTALNQWMKLIVILALVFVAIPRHVHPRTEAEDSHV
jgi:oligosaccharide repeat unit polymerase